MAARCPDVALRVAEDDRLVGALTAHQMTCPKCNGVLWLCEKHGKPWESCCDVGPGVPCECNPEERMPPGFKEHCSVNDRLGELTNLSMSDSGKKEQ